MNATMKAGFYGTDSEVYMVTDGGKVFIVASGDDVGPDPVEIAELPESVISIDSMMTPDEAAEHFARVEAVL